MNPTSPVKPSEPYESALAKAIRAMTRNCTIYPVSGFFGLGNKPIHKIAIRVNVKSEEDTALVQAHRYVADLAAGVESAKQDGDLVTDAKTRHALVVACREVVTTVAEDGTETDEIRNWPAFPGPAFLADHCTTDQIATLLNLYNQTRAEQSGWFDSFDDETVASLLNIAADSADNPLCRVMLAQMPREQIQKLLVVAAHQLREAKRAAPPPEDT